MMTQKIFQLNNFIIISMVSPSYSMVSKTGLVTIKTESNWFGPMIISSVPGNLPVGDFSAARS